MIDFDNSYTVSELEILIKNKFPNIKKIKSNASTFYVGEYNNKKFSLRVKNVTYLGNPHPIYKKRIQIPDDLFEFYKSSIEMGATPFLIGVYSGSDNLIFVDFKIDTYIQNKANNSSAHVYTSDLKAATEDNFFQKIDYFGNQVTVFDPEHVNTFLEDNLISDSNFYNEIYNEREFCSNSKDEITRKFKIDVEPKIHEYFKGVKKRWDGILAYKEMNDNNYKNSKQPEWPGFYNEYLFEKFLNDKDYKNYIQFYQDKSKGGIDLDLFFPSIQKYGDLKTHSETSRGIPGNDWNTVQNLIKDMNGHIYYIVCVHETNKDIDFNSEVTIYWNTLLKKENKLSYQSKMKHDVKLKKAYILDINCENYRYLSKFKQGVNSNGKPREPKIMIENDNFEYFVIDELELEEEV